MDVRVVSKSAGDVVDFGLLKVHCRVRSVHDDALLRHYARSAADQFEEHTCRKLLHTALELQLPCFPSCNRPIKLPCPPLVAVTSINYLDADNQEQTTTGTVRQGEIFAYLYPADPDEGWPEVSSRGYGNEVRINILSGYGVDHNAVEEGIKFSLMCLVDRWYEDRTIGEVPDAIRNLWGPYETEPLV